MMYNRFVQVHKLNEQVPKIISRGVRNPSIKLTLMQLFLNIPHKNNLKYILIFLINFLTTQPYRMGKLYIILYTLCQIVEVIYMALIFAQVQAAFQLRYEIFADLYVQVLEFGLEGFTVVDEDQGVQYRLCCIQLMDVF